MSDKCKACKIKRCWLNRWECMVCDWSDKPLYPKVKNSND